MLNLKSLILFSLSLSLSSCGCRSVFGGCGYGSVLGGYLGDYRLVIGLSFGGCVVDQWVVICVAVGCGGWWFFGLLAVWWSVNNGMVVGGF